MKLSVCIFTYNHVKFIRQTIESVLMQQTDFDFEIVIGDDCSTDGTADVVREYQGLHPEKVRAFLNPENLGIMGNNVYTLSQCTGEYVALLDGDDYWTHQRKLQAQADFLDSHQQYVFCFHDGRILRLDGAFDETTCCGAKQKRHVTLTDIICDTHIPTFSIVFRRSSLSPFPPERYFDLKSPDRPVFLLLASKGPGYYIDECWAVYRKHPNGCWTSQTFQYHWMVHLQIYKTMNAHFKQLYNESFGKCESCVTYILAMALLRNREYRKAACYFRKYVRLRKGNFSSRIKMYFNVAHFLVVYVANRIQHFFSKRAMVLEK